MDGRKKLQILSLRAEKGRPLIFQDAADYPGESMVRTLCTGSMSKLLPLDPDAAWKKVPGGEAREKVFLERAKRRVPLP